MQVMEPHVYPQNVQAEEDIVTRLGDGSYQVRLDNILTTDQVLFPGMVLLKLEGTQTDVVKILDIQVKDGFLYLKIEDQKTGLPYIISHQLGSEFFLWTLISYDYFIDKLLARAKQMGTEIEFDF
jgi:hypothetical protein